MRFSPVHLLTGVAFVSTLLVGCATMNAQQCKTADWRTIGYEHGLSGAPQSRFTALREDCADHGVTPNLDAYREGHNQGVRHFCTPQNGFATGRRGNRLSTICPADLVHSFSAEHQRGFAIYRIEQKLRSAERALREEENAIDIDLKRITEIESLLIHEAGDAEKRKHLIAEMRGLESGVAHHYRVRDDLLREIDQIRAELTRTEP